MVLRHLWDQSHIGWSGNHGTSPNCGFLSGMDVERQN